MLSQFITFRDEQKFFVLQTAFPHYLGEVIRGEKPEGVFVATVSGYRIYIRFSGALGGNRMLIMDNWKENMKSIITSMGDFYLGSRIAPEPKKFREWRTLPESFL